MFPFEFVQSVSDLVCAIIVHKTVDQDQEVPIRLCSSISARPGTEENDLRVGFYLADRLFYEFK